MKLILLILFSATILNAKPIFLEKKGIVAIEMESTQSSLRKWKKKTSIDGYSGECHLEFTGNQISSGPPNSPLKYKFKITKAGKYDLILRAHKRLENERQDLSNDCYVSMKGDFEAVNAPLSILKKDTKLYGGKSEGWGWAHKLDESHKKYPSQYIFKKGEVYTLTISGRSKNFNLDRILFIHESHSIGDVKKLNPPESKTDQSPPPKPLTRTLTNLDGKTISVKIHSLKGNDLSVTVKGKPHTIDISTLSEEDQIFLREWAEDQ